MHLPAPVVTAITNLCKAHHVKTLYAFGSVFTEAFKPESDIDLLVDFAQMAPEKYANNYFDLKFALQDVLERPVDLLEEQAISNPYFRQTIDKQKQLVYGY